MNEQVKVMFWYLADDGPQFVAEIAATQHPDGTPHIIATEEGLRTLANLFVDALPFEMPVKPKRKPRKKIEGEALAVMD